MNPTMKIALKQLTVKHLRQREMYLSMLIQLWLKDNKLAWAFVNREGQFSLIHRDTRKAIRVGSGGREASAVGKLDDRLCDLVLRNPPTREAITTLVTMARSRRRCCLHSGAYNVTPWSRVRRVRLV